MGRRRSYSLKTNCERILLLALDTATATASLALYDLENERLLAEWTWEARRRQTQDLFGAARTLLDQLDCTPDDLTALAVTTGPGSFTGVRIGISAIKGMALGLVRTPRVVGIPTLRVTAAPWLAAAAAGNEPTVVCPCIQAGRGRYNWVVFEPNDAPLRPTGADHEAGTAEQFAAALGQWHGGSIWLVGEVDAELEAHVRGLAHVTAMDRISGWRRAGHLAALAATAIAADEADGLADLQPLYLRSPG
jgi:tRNA threonylcarbamoyladenosine biosynthesis protein TsaB